MNSYFGYVRVSTTRQGEGSSMQEQKSAIEAYAARNSLQITGWFEEMETAAKQGRRVFNRMLADLGRGRASGVIIHKIDRSARNLRDWAQLGELNDRGVEVHFAHESIDLQSRGGRLSADIQAVVAADYIRNLRQEVKKGFYGRLKQGLYPLGAPYGYQDEGGGKAKSIHPVTGPLVRQMFELYATGRYPLNALREEMRQRGLVRAGGSAMSLGAVATLLHNPFYIGIIRLRKSGEVFQGVHEPLISAALYDRVQATLSGRAFPHIIKHGFAFRRLIKCARCARSLIGETRKGHVYYRCHARTCRGTCLREDAIVEGLHCEFALLRVSDEELQDLRDFGDELSERDREANQVRKGQRARALGLCQDRLLRLTDAFLDGDVDKATYNERKAALLLERSGLAETAEPETGANFQELMEKVGLGNMAQLQLESLDSAKRREIVEITTSDLRVDGKNLAITLRFPFQEVANAHRVRSGAPSRGRPRTSHVGQSSLTDVASGAPARGRPRTLKSLMIKRLVAKSRDKQLAA